MSVLSPNPQASYPTTMVMTRTTSVQLNPVVTAAAYTANQCVGGRLIFNNILGTQQSGVLQNVTVGCRITNAVGYKLYLFTANPSNTTVTDRTSITLSPLDVPYLVDVITLGGADTTLGPSISVTDNIGRAVVSTTQALYGILLTTGAPTYTSANDIFVTLTVLQD